MNNKRLNLAQTVTLRTAIQSMLSSACIVSYGIVKDKPASGIVTVELSVANSAKDIKVITCVLLSPASSTFTVDIVPEIGDKVLVLYPDKFDSDMFDVSQDEVIINNNATGYNLFGGVAILMNQYKKSQHHNYIQCKDGELIMHLAYDKNEDENLLTIATGKDGAVTLTSNESNVVSLDKDGNYAVENSKGQVRLNKDGYLSYKNIDDNKTELTFTSSGFTVQDKNGCKIVSSSQNISINGKLTINTIKK